MELKYLCRNEGYIIDRKTSRSIESESINTYITKGNMILTQDLPMKNDQIKKNVIEYAFDQMKENVLEEYKKKYHLKDKDLINYYFEGNLEQEQDKEEKISYIELEDSKVPIQKTNFNLTYEVELKIKPINFFKIQYENISQ